MFKLILSIILIIQQVNCQKGDYNFTSSCNDCNFGLKWNNTGKQTYFIFSVKLSNNATENASWAAFSFSKDLNMGSDDMNVCKTLGANNSTVEHYIKGVDGTSAPELIDSSNPSYGFSNINVKLNKDMLVCSFVRENKMPNEKYFELPNKFHLLLSYGSITNGALIYKNFRVPSDNTYSF